MSFVVACMSSSDAEFSYLYWDLGFRCLREGRRTELFNVELVLLAGFGML